MYFKTVIANPQLLNEKPGQSSRKSVRSACLIESEKYTVNYYDLQEGKTVYNFDLLKHKLISLKSKACRSRKSQLNARRGDYLNKFTLKKCTDINKLGRMQCTREQNST